MKTEQIIILVVAFFLGMLLLNMVKNVCGCEVKEGFNPNDFGGLCISGRQSDCNAVIRCNENVLNSPQLVGYGGCGGVEIGGSADALNICDTNLQGGNCELSNDKGNLNDVFTAEGDEGANCQTAAGEAMNFTQWKALAEASFSGLSDVCRTPPPTPPPPTQPPPPPAPPPTTPCPTTCDDNKIRNGRPSVDGSPNRDQLQSACCESCPTGYQSSNSSSCNECARGYGALPTLSRDDPPICVSITGECTDDQNTIWSKFILDTPTGSSYLGYDCDPVLFSNAWKNPGFNEMELQDDTIRTNCLPPRLAGHGAIYHDQYSFCPAPGRADADPDVDCTTRINECLSDIVSDLNNAEQQSPPSPSPSPPTAPPPSTPPSAGPTESANTGTQRTITFEPINDSMSADWQMAKPDLPGFKNAILTAFNDGCADAEQQFGENTRDLPGCDFPIYLKTDPGTPATVDGVSTRAINVEGDCNQAARARNKDEVLRALQRAYPGQEVTADNLAGAMCVPTGWTTMQAIPEELNCPEDARTTTSGAQGGQPRPVDSITLDDIKIDACPRAKQTAIESAQLDSGAATLDDIPDVYRKIYYWQACKDGATANLYNAIAQDPRLPLTPPDGDNPVRDSCPDTPDGECGASSYCLKHNPGAVQMGMGEGEPGRVLCDQASALSTSECGFCGSVDWQMDFDTMKEIQCSNLLEESMTRGLGMSYHAKNQICDPNYGNDMKLWATGENECVDRFADPAESACSELATTSSSTCGWCTGWLSDPRSTRVRRCQQQGVQDTGFMLDDGTTRTDCDNYINQAIKEPTYYGPNGFIKPGADGDPFSDICSALFDPNGDGSGGGGCDFTCGFCGSR